MLTQISHVIVCEDADVPFIYFDGRDANARAEKRFNELSVSWNANLYIRIDEGLNHPIQLNNRPSALDEEVPYLIVFGDETKKPIMVAGCGARTSAIQAFSALKNTDRVYLFGRFRKNHQNDDYPSLVMDGVTDCFPHE